MGSIVKQKTKFGTVHISYVYNEFAGESRSPRVKRRHLGVLDVDNNELLRSRKVHRMPAHILEALKKAGIAYNGRSIASIPNQKHGGRKKSLAGIERLVSVTRRLRAPDGCPWDREQTHESLKECMIGEVAEYLDAVDATDDAEMREELGDVLMQVVMNSVIAEERGAFTFDDVASEIAEKMVRRHPHVFGDVKVANSAEVLVNWDRIKKTEKGESADAPVRKSALDRIPRSLPALYRAQKMQRKAAKHGFDWDSVPPILDKIHEELDELDAAFHDSDSVHVEEEVGDLLFAIVNFIRARGNDSEEILNRASDKFDRRYRRMEDILAGQGREVDDCSAQELDAIWNQVKSEEHS